MIDRETAEQGLAALAVAIASILEDVHDLAVMRQATLDEHGQAAADLVAAGVDVATLAAAMKIFVRRGGESQIPLD